MLLKPIWSHLREKSLIENFIFYAVSFMATAITSADDLGKEGWKLTRSYPHF